jgi:hypothetical protein
VLIAKKEKLKNIQNLIAYVFRSVMIIVIDFLSLKNFTILKDVSLRDQKLTIK